MAIPFQPLKMHQLADSTLSEKKLLCEIFIDRWEFPAKFHQSLNYQGQRFTKLFVIWIAILCLRKNKVELAYVECWVFLMLGLANWCNRSIDVQGRGAWRSGEVLQFFNFPFFIIFYYLFVKGLRPLCHLNTKFWTKRIKWINFSNLYLIKTFKDDRLHQTIAPSHFLLFFF